MSATVVTTIFKFGEEAVQATRKGACSVCGKPTRRSTTFTGTVNPWNVTDDGKGGKREKTVAEVRADLKAEAEAWQPDPKVFDHVKCAAERDHPADDSPVEPEQRPEDRDTKTGMLLDAMSLLGTFIRHHGLATMHVEFRPPWGSRADEGFAIDVQASSHAEFMQWCEALGVETIQLDCTRDDTYLRMKAPMPTFFYHGRGVEVRMWMSMPRGPLGERLPGVTDFEWPPYPGNSTGRHKAPQVPIEHIRTALRRLRIADRVAPLPSVTGE